MDNQKIIKSDVINNIEHWFKTTGGGGLILPDGWFGRPYDNLHRLTFIITRPNKVILELDSQLYLVFTALTKVHPDGADLLFKDFAQCIFDWQEYGSLKPHASVYGSGEVRFVVSDCDDR